MRKTLKSSGKLELALTEAGVSLFSGGLATAWEAISECGKRTILDFHEAIPSIPNINYDHAFAGLMAVSSVVFAYSLVKNLNEYKSEKDVLNVK